MPNRRPKKPPNDQPDAQVIGEFNKLNGEKYFVLEFLNDHSLAILSESKMNQTFERALSNAKPL